MAPRTEPLRAALEFAFLVAVIGSQRKPPIAAPVGLRQFLRFQKLPPAAREPVRSAVDNDDEFRLRLANAADEAVLGRAGWLWLTRPEGWQAELTELTGEPSSGVVGDSSVSRQATAARSAKAELATVKTVVARLTAERDSLVATNVKLQRVVAESDAAVANLRKKVASLTKRLADKPALPGPGLPHPVPVPTPLSTLLPIALPDPEPTIDIARVRSSITQAARALADIEMLLTTAKPTTGPSADRPRKSAQRRVPVVVAAGVLVDSVEGAVQLLQAGVLVIIDGYNVAKQAWPKATLLEQREQLLDVVTEVSARHHTSVNVVFDGAAIPGGARRNKRLPVTFSPAGVSADEVIIEMVRGLPYEHGVVVVTSDREVREAGERLGARLMHSRTFMAAAARQRGQSFGV